MQNCFCTSSQCNLNFCQMGWRYNDVMAFYRDKAYWVHWQDESAIPHNSHQYVNNWLFWYIFITVWECTRKGNFWVKVLSKKLCGNAGNYGHLFVFGCVGRYIKYHPQQYSLCQNILPSLVVLPIRRASGIQTRTAPPRSLLIRLVLQFDRSIRTDLLNNGSLYIFVGAFNNNNIMIF